MTKDIFYTYLGTNGTLETPIHLEDIYSIKKYRLIADKGHYLFNGEKKEKVVVIPEAELSNWTEIQE